MERVRAACERAQPLPKGAEEYLAHLREKGRTEGTLQTYRRSLGLLYRTLPVEGEIGPETLLAWQGELVAMGYGASTVNTCLSVAGNYLEYLGVRTAVPEQLALPEEARPELTRREYLRLLCAARELGKERTYLLVKVIAVTGVTVQELPRVTVEGIRQGRVEVSPGGVKSVLRIPGELRRELLDYAGRRGITGGPVFATREGRAMNRTNVTDSIRRLCREAQVPEEKGNPRCLRRLYLDTWEGIRRSLEVLAEQSYERLLEEEQETAGWDRKT